MNNAALQSIGIMLGAPIVFLALVYFASRFTTFPRFIIVTSFVYVVTLMYRAVIYVSPSSFDIPEINGFQSIYALIQGIGLVLVFFWPWFVGFFTSSKPENKYQISTFSIITIIITSILLFPNRISSTDTVGYLIAILIFLYSLLFMFSFVLCIRKKV